MPSRASAQWGTCAEGDSHAGKYLDVHFSFRVRQQSEWYLSQTLAEIFGTCLKVFTCKFHVCQRHVNRAFAESYMLNIEIVTQSFTKLVVISIVYLHLLLFLTMRNVPGRLFFFL